MFKKKFEAAMLYFGKLSTSDFVGWSEASFLLAHATLGRNHLCLSKEIE